ncbi:hypothetical protein LguiB_008574 [Lonicera macranthoides]
MWLPRGGGVNGDRKEGGGNKVVAVAIDKNKGSQHALKWASDNLLTRGQTVVLIYVLHKSSSSHSSLLMGGNHGGAVRDVNGAVSVHKESLEKQTKELRFKVSDVPSNVSKGAPDFCTVYVISKGKISSVRNASRSAPFISPLHEQIQEKFNNTNGSQPESRPRHSFSMKASEMTPRKRPPHLSDDGHEQFRSPLARGGSKGGLIGRLGGLDLSESDTDISFVSSGRPSTDRLSTYNNMIYDSMDSAPNSRNSTASSSDHSFVSSRLGAIGRGIDISPLHEFSSTSFESERTSCSSPNAVDDVEGEMRKLKLELQKTMDMYSTACKEALTAKEKATELHRWRAEEERRLEEARVAQQAALVIAEKEKSKCRAALETAEAAQRIAELEAERRINAEMKALKEAEERDTVLLGVRRHQYKRYTIDEIEEATEYFSQLRKIGEGGYGPVFKCILDHTRVAVKVLRPDAAQGRSQFQQEVEVLSRMRHPNMVLLLGACPEYGCLIYEYMAKGSLDDRLFRRGNTPPLSWQLRFRIAAEIATGLLFLHQTKPEPLVHRDLKPANILLDHNYVSKISDVGLARLVPPSVADDVTQYRMTSTAGTFCYIDPEYQQTGMLGVKSDVYSLGVMLLQIITAKPPMGLTHQVEQSIENGTFPEMLDPVVGDDWPVEEALGFAKLALQCAELRRKDRPDLGKVVLPELNRLRALGEENMASHYLLMGGGVGASPSPSPNHSQVSTVLSDPLAGHDHSGYDSSKTQSISSH